MSKPKVSREEKMSMIQEKLETGVREIFESENYKEYISHEHNLGIKNIADLIGKNLSCWCAKDCLCHADILLELATKVERHYR